MDILESKAIGRPYMGGKRNSGNAIYRAVGNGASILSDLSLPAKGAFVHRLAVALEGDDQAREQGMQHLVTAVRAEMKTAGGVEAELMAIARQRVYGDEDSTWIPNNISGLATDVGKFVNNVYDHVVRSKEDPLRIPVLPLSVAYFGERSVSIVSLPPPVYTHVTPMN